MQQSKDQSPTSSRHKQGQGSGLEKPQLIKVLKFIDTADTDEIGIIVANLLHKAGGNVWFKIDWEGLIDWWQCEDDKEFTQMLMDEIRTRHELPLAVYKGLTQTMEG